MVYIMTVWLGNAPERCDLCGGLTNDVFYDARLPRYAGLWAHVCGTCFSTQHCLLGVGVGQRYERRGDQFVCTAGGRDAKEKDERDKLRAPDV
jgi:hypothetical protein